MSCGQATKGAVVPTDPSKAQGSLHPSILAQLEASEREARSAREADPNFFHFHSPFKDESLDVMLLLTTAIKFADLNHCSKPFIQHEAWTRRVTDEFWSLGDKERKLGVPLSPLCDREKDKNIAKSQLGFFQFICIPFYDVVGDLVDPSMPPLLQMQTNFAQWKEQAEAQKKDGVDESTQST